MKPLSLFTVKLKLLVLATALSLPVGTATADILYGVARGQAMVNGVLQEGVTVEFVPCDGARLPADWPSPAPQTTSTSVDPNTGFNFSLVFTECCGNPNTPGPSGSFTFFAANGAWFTAIDMQLRFTFSDCPPVTLSCEQVRQAYDATTNSGSIGEPVFNINIDCLPHFDFVPGDTASIGFWANKNGQALIKSLNGGQSSTALGNWLASNFPYLYGANAGANNLTGKSNKDVAAYFARLKKSTGPKVYAQILATALAVYVTDSDLAGDAGVKYGFNVSPEGTGEKTYNVGPYGSAIGLINDAEYSVFSLLQQANLQKQAGTFNASAFSFIFNDINERGDRL